MDQGRTTDGTPLERSALRSTRRSARSLSVATAALGGLALVVGQLAACGSGGGASGEAGYVEELKPSGEAFLVDPNRGGGQSRPKLVEMTWGRLVDIHDVDQFGNANIDPVFKDFVINENVQTDATNFILETNPITQETRLIVKRQKGAPSVNGLPTFENLVSQISLGLPSIAPKHDDGTSPAPFSSMARNACLVLRFSDCLDDSPKAVANLVNTVKVLSGYRPTQPLFPRMLFDPNHGAVVGGKFHSTRILIDMTVSEAEASAATNFIAVNTEGLPASLINNTNPNISVRIPTVEDPGSLQFQVLRGLSGGPVDASSGPVDRTVRTMEVVRAFRSGSSADVNNGFMLDLNEPEVVGDWPITLSNPVPNSNGITGFDFTVDLTFTSVCQDALKPGDIVASGTLFLEVQARTSKPDLSGLIPGVDLRLIADTPLTNTSQLVGIASLLSTFSLSSSVDTGCWLSFTPQAQIVPTGSVSTRASIVVRFSEPIDSASVTPFDTFMVLRGDSGLPTIRAEEIVVGRITPAPDLRSFTYVPLVPFKHDFGQFEPMNVRLGDVTDLSGNSLALTLPPVDFTLDPNAATESNSSVAMRFSDIDELDPVDLQLGSFDDLRGQVFYDFERGRIRPRDVTFTSYQADRTNPVPSIMIPFPSGVQTPLSALGSKLQTVWRYVDFGWNAADETKYNLDVYGLSWSPIGGVVLRDFFEQFEIRLSHSAWLPDEDIDGFLLPLWRGSGLRGGAGAFTQNIHNDPLSPQKVVHPKELGYQVNPVNLTQSSTGTPLMPFPLNQRRTGPLSTYTWRDTAALGKAGSNSAGVPMDIEAGNPLNIVPQEDRGSLWPSGQVPTAGLPLLMEYRCFPSSEGIGLNPLDISLAINSSAIPSFRSYSTGGVNTTGDVVTVNPEQENAARGGFNPSTNPPGERTNRSDDNAFYIGQMDVVTRISRAHTIWIKTAFEAVEFLPPVLIPDPSNFPVGTQVVLDFRGATGFDIATYPDAEDWARDAAHLDAYGTVQDLAVTPHRDVDVTYITGNKQWVSNITDLDGSKYVQIRFSFVNNIESGTAAELSAVGLAYLEQ